MLDALTELSEPGPEDGHLLCKLSVELLDEFPMSYAEAFLKPQLHDFEFLLRTLEGFLGQHQCGKSVHTNGQSVQVLKFAAKCEKLKFTLPATPGQIRRLCKLGMSLEKAWALEFLDLLGSKPKSTSWVVQFFEEAGKCKWWESHEWASPVLLETFYARILEPMIATVVYAPDSPGNDLSSITKADLVTLLCCFDKY